MAALVAVQAVAVQQVQGLAAKAITVARRVWHQAVLVVVVRHRLGLTAAAAQRAATAARQARTPMTELHGLSQVVVVVVEASRVARQERTLVMVEVMRPVQRQPQTLVVAVVGLGQTLLAATAAQVVWSFVI
jgi:hypothetical protein